MLPATAVPAQRTRTAGHSSLLGMLQWPHSAPQSAQHHLGYGLRKAGNRVVDRGLMVFADACGHPSPDTVRALPCLCVPASPADRHARDWWEPAFASLLFPGARVSPRRISEVLADPGSEDAKRGSVRAYLALLGKGGGKGEGVLAEDGGSPVGSTGLPNSPGCPARRSRTTTAKRARRRGSSMWSSRARACRCSSAT